MKQLTENIIEIFAIKLLKRLGYQYLYALDIAHDSDSPELSCFEEVINLVFLKIPINTNPYPRKNEGYPFRQN